MFPQATCRSLRATIGRLSVGALVLLAMFVLSASCGWTHPGGPSMTSDRRQSAFAARRAADDSRPLARFNSFQASETNESPIVMGKFRAPAPERIYRTRVPNSSQFATQTMSASYRVADSSSIPEKLVHGIAGASTDANNKQRVVGAKIQVSDEGLNYPPSKLSADIYGNVAEIVTAPPEAVDSDFLLPNSRRFSASRP